MKQTLIIAGIIFAGIFALWLVEPLFGDDVVNEIPVVNIADRPVENLDRMEKVVTEREIDNSPVQQDTKVTVSPDPVEVTKPAPASVVEPQPELLQGSLRGSGSYRASGSAFISGQDLSLVNLDSSNVPDGRVYLSNGTGAQDFVDLGALKGNKGNQNYRIPSNIDASKYSHVLIWCRAFSSLIGSARI